MTRRQCMDDGHAGCERITERGNYCPPCASRRRAEWESSRSAEWKRLRGYVLDRDSHACAVCHVMCPHPNHHDVDHVDGDRMNHRLSNLQVLCRSCHAKKGSHARRDNARS